VTGQSVSKLQATQLPLPSQTEPPLSWHIVPVIVSVVPQVPAVHAFALQAVVGAGQLVASLHATQLPLPSHTVPPWSEHVVPFVAFFAEQHPAVQLAIAQVVEVQSVAALHVFWHVGLPPPLLLLLVTLTPLMPLLVVCALLVLACAAPPVAPPP
jgi:hypothetical protein